MLPHIGTRAPVESIRYTQLSAQRWVNICGGYMRATADFVILPHLECALCLNIARAPAELLLRTCLCWLVPSRKLFSGLFSHLHLYSQLVDRSVRRLLTTSQCTPHKPRCPSPIRSVCSAKWIAAQLFLMESK